MAITYIDNATAGFSSAATLTTSAFGSAVHAGDLLIVAGYISGLSSQATITVHDNLNSGSWTVCNNEYNAAGGTQTFVAYIACDTTGSAGTTTITAGDFSSGGYLFGLHYNGFTATPTLIGSDTTSNAGNSATYAATGFTNSHTNELLIGTVWLPSGSDTAGSPGGAWTDRASGANARTMDELLTTSGNSVTFTGSVTPSAPWIATLTGFYDGVPGAALASAATESTTATGTLGLRHVVADMVQESTTTTGTSPFSLNGALTGFRSFGSAMNDQDTCLYLAQAVTGGAPNGPWEIGIGTYNLSTNSLTRTQVLKSSNSNALVPFATGTTNIALTEPAEVLWNKGVYDAGPSGSAITIDWVRGPHQMVTLTANCTITFQNSMLCPRGTLEIYQDATGSRVPTISGAVYRSGSPPVWSTTNATHDTLDVYYNVVTSKSNVFLKT